MSDINNEDNVDIDYFDYFYTKYNTDIVDIFLKIKDYSNSFCLNFFNTKYQNKNGSLDLTEFLFENIILEEEIHNESKEENSHYNEEEEY